MHIKSRFSLPSVLIRVTCVFFHVFQVNSPAMASARKGQYGGGDVVDKYLMNQVMKYVKLDELGSLARDLGVDESVYETIAAPKDRIFKVRSQNTSKKKISFLHQRPEQNLAFPSELFNDSVQKRLAQ